MTDSRMDEVKSERKLKGKINFVSWKREFERVAKRNDVLEYLIRGEIVPPKPRKEDYFEKLVEAETRPLTRSMMASRINTPLSEEDKEVYDVQTTMPSTNTLRWQIDYNEYRTTKEKMKLAGNYLMIGSWAASRSRSKIRARDDLLSQLNLLKLDNCPSMTEYTNKIRQIKADLETARYDMTDDMLATALLHGLPPNFLDFKEKYDWIRSTNPEEPPDLDYLYERLHIEEAKQFRLKEERWTREKARKETSGNSNPHGGTSHNGNRKPKREDRSHLKCTYPGCGETGHNGETCWTGDPSNAGSPRRESQVYKDNLSLADTEN
ncbi:hypothetical protein O1611_g5954 [Lasiodiplodia mahajangana]|uniref:Uncharacterized protein n=1 Tax=Lasiodiplodia mahajangana TaxID=1108764 RepID=A0ACC2JJZ5_9PEZI|nr:hypothetical protein O1611_g5954 [Lasiodiplodia mahajangana]